MRALAAAIVFLVVAAPAAAASYSGLAKVPAVVWVSDAAPAPAPDAAIRQTGKTFVPALLVVPVGTGVRFPNDDPFYHSVYSTSPENAFDLGLYDTGPGKTVTFSAPGIVDIHCHVHGSMHATIVVVDGPFVQTTQANQRYTLDNLTPGNHVLHVYDGGASVSATPIVVR
jgi:plastocyanin